MTLLFDEGLSPKLDPRALRATVSPARETLEYGNTRYRAGLFGLYRQ